MAKKTGKKNEYAQKAKKTAALSMVTHTLPTKGNIKNSALETVKDLAGVVGGGFAGAAIGKPSLLVGLGLAAAGHFTDSPLATSLGIGMMASNGFQKSSSVQGVDGTEGIDGFDMASVKSRLTAYKENFMEKTYLDKVIPKKSSSSKEEPANGLDGMQFFNYRNDIASADNELNGELSSLDHIDRQLEQSAKQYMRNKGMENMGEFDGTDDISDMEINEAKDYNL